MKLALKMLGFLGVVLCFAFASPNDAPLAIKPDLKVSKISTPGGLCIGTQNKVMVTITNSQMAGVNKKIPVILYVSIPGKKPSSYVEYLNNGIGPNDNSGKPVWFNNVDMPGQGTATIKAVVNPDQTIEESVYNNNTKVQNFTVPNQTCGGNNNQNTPPQGKNLTVTVFKHGTWSNGNYQGIQSANVLVKKNNQTIGSGSTGSNGKVTINNIPVGMCTIVVIKSGCTQVNQNYNMPSYNTNVNIEMTCN